MNMKITLTKKEALEIIKSEIELRCLDMDYRQKLDNLEVVITE